MLTVLTVVLVLSAQSTDMENIELSLCNICCG